MIQITSNHNQHFFSPTQVLGVVINCYSVWCRKPDIGWQPLPCSTLQRRVGRRSRHKLRPGRHNIRRHRRSNGDGPLSFPIFSIATFLALALFASIVVYSPQLNIYVEEISHHKKNISNKAPRNLVTKRFEIN